jgi:hypothetical protein
LTDRVRELILDVCHEVANLLAAARLEGRVPAPGSPAALQSSLARAGTLLGLVRALLDGSPPGSCRVEPLEVLAAVRAAFEEADAERVRIELATAVDLPDVAADAVVLADLLVADVHAALAGDGAPVCVRASVERDGAAVLFAVEDHPGAGEGASADPARGRALTCALAEAVVVGWGGTANGRRETCGPRLELRIPVSRRGEAGERGAGVP